MVGKITDCKRQKAVILYKRINVASTQHAAVLPFEEGRK